MAISFDFNSKNVILVSPDFFPGELGEKKSGNLSSTSDATILSINKHFTDTNTNNHATIRPYVSDPSITTPTKFKQVGREVTALVQHMAQLNSDPRIAAGKMLLEQDEDIKLFYALRQSELIGA